MNKPFTPKVGDEIQQWSRRGNEEVWTSIGICESIEGHVMKYRGDDGALRAIMWSYPSGFEVVRYRVKE